MVKLDRELLVRAGLGSLRADLANVALQTMYDILQMRVGVAIADLMTDAQLEEFEGYFEAKDDAGAFAWLASNFPNYKNIVQSCYDELSAEAATDATKVLDAVAALVAERDSAAGSFGRT